MDLNNAIIEQISAEGCQIFGFADLRALDKSATQGFPYAVIMGLNFSAEAMKENIQGAPQRYHQENECMTLHLGRLRENIAGFLTQAGYNAQAETTSLVWNPETLRAQLQFKTVATLAGLGFIGKCAVLITPEAGSALRLAVVLTDAPLVCATPVKSSNCPENCTICADVCPGKAPLGPNWAHGKKREEFFDAYVCESAGRIQTEKFFDIERNLCGLCISHCPFTKKALQY